MMVGMRKEIINDIKLTLLKWVIEIASTITRQVKTVIQEIFIELLSATTHAQYINMNPEPKVDPITQ